MLDELVRLLLFVLPAYVANAAPVALGGYFPIDKNRKIWDKRPIFGPSKTWMGLAGGMAAGMLCAVLEAHLLRGTTFDLWGGKPEWYLASGFLLSAGALFGDLIGSFVKRRLAAAPGQPSLLLDQLPFILVALAFVWPLGIRFPFQPLALIALGSITIVLHRAANMFAHTAGLKRVPW
ncbi:CDP-archaeol synthase [uncultured archaeon]|nr:CDP-archaeol synthase [uncultured archaeon]